jgi:hypothetical protein
LALAEFPELVDDFDSVDGMPTLYASIFGERLQRAKGSADWDNYACGIRLIERLWNSPAPRSQRALRWGEMKGLDFDGPRGPVAWDCLNPELRRAWASTHKRIEALAAVPRKAKPQKRRRP